MLKLSVIGNLGNDPELKMAATGTAVLRFNVAANYRAKNEQNEWADRTEWVRCTVFGKRAESLAEMIRKGSRVYVEGRLEARPWTDNQGQVRAGLELVTDTVEFMSSRQDDPMTPRTTVNRQPVAAGASDEDADLPF
jgi:single-strand DNA-binding protein